MPAEGGVRKPGVEKNEVALTPARPLMDPAPPPVPPQQRGYYGDKARAAPPPLAPEGAWGGGQG